MRIKVLVLFVLLTFLQLFGASRELFLELESLKNNGRYELMVEKALQLINDDKLELNSEERAELFFFIAEGYGALKNTPLHDNYLSRSIAAAPLSRFAARAMLLQAQRAPNANTMISLLQEIMQKFPQSSFYFEALLELARYHYRFRNFQQIYNLVQRVEFGKTDGEVIARIKMLYAAACYQLKRYYDAVQNIIYLELNVPLLLRESPDFLLLAGNIYFENLNYDKARYYLIRMINIYPRDPQVTEAAMKVATIFEKEKNPFLGAVFLVSSASRENDDYPLLLRLVQLLDQLSEGELTKIRELNFRLSERDNILHFIIDNAALHEHRREAMLLLASGRKIASDIGSTIDFYLKTLSKKRDSQLENVFRQKITTFLERGGADPIEQMLIWSKLKFRKSLLNEDILLKFASSFTKLGFFLETEEILQHLLNYKMYRSSWEQAEQIYLKIDLLLGRYDKINPERLKKIKSDPELCLLYLKALRNSRQGDEYSKCLVEYQPSALIGFFESRILEQKALLLQERGNLREAREIVGNLLSSSHFSGGEYNALLLQKADLDFLLGETEEALQSYLALLEKNAAPGDWITFQAAACYFRKGDQGRFNSMKDLLQKNHPQSFYIEKIKIYVR